LDGTVLTGLVKSAVPVFHIGVGTDVGIEGGCIKTPKSFWIFATIRELDPAPGVRPPLSVTHHQLISPNLITAEDKRQHRRGEMRAIPKSQMVA
jgi:hypothetical protein